jgi:hypothetical protein
MVPMNKLSNLLQKIDHFHRQAVLAYSLLKYGAEGDTPEELLEAAEDLWDQTQNKLLADQLENIIKSYRKFNEALNASPGDMVDPEQSAIDEADTIDSLAETLNDRWKRLVANPYLELSADDSRYEEEAPPQKYLEVAQSLVDDANRFLEQKAQQAGFTPEELKYMQEQERAPELPGAGREQDAENKKRSEVMSKRKIYDKTFRDKLKQIHKVGPENLVSVRNELEQKIQTTTNQIEKEEMERRLKNLPNPESYYKYLDRVRKNYEAIKADPARNQKMMQGAAERQAKVREFDTKKRGLIEAITRATSPNDKSRFTNELVRLEEEILRRKGKDLDDPFVANDPMIMSMLNPTEIIRRFQTSRAAKMAPGGEYRTKEVQHRQKLYQAGELPGLVLTFRHDLATVVSEVKKALGRKIDKTGPNDPVFKPYYQAVMSAKDPQAKAAAMAALDAFAKQYKETHPLVKQVTERIAPLVVIKDELAELTSSRRKGEAVAYKNPWIVSNEPLSEQQKSMLSVIHQKLSSKIGTGFGDIPGANLDAAMRKIADAIREKLEG